MLVIGASASGIQLADELHRSGRPVTLAVGSHQRLPRRYRGMDTFWWLDLIGAFDRTVDEVLLPAMRAVGEGWHAGRTDVSHEHLATTATQAWLATQTSPGALRPQPPIMK